MTKKGILILAASVVTTAAIAVGGTLAWFTSGDEVKNTFTVGKVNISLEEPKVVKDGNDWFKTDEMVTLVNGVKGNTYQDIYPGAVLPKEPIVKVEKGSEDCYVRMLVMVDNWDKMSAAVKDYYTGIMKSFDNNGWKYVTNYTYGANNSKEMFVMNYTSMISKNTTADTSITAPFDKITVPTWVNQQDVSALKESGFTIDIVAEAIQAKGFSSVEAAMKTMDAPDAGRPAVNP